MYLLYFGKTQLFELATLMNIDKTLTILQGLFIVIKTGNVKNLKNVFKYI